MYGKHFASMYSGSMIGSGAVVFAVWGYVVASYHLDEEVGAQVELNPKLLGAILGEPEDSIRKAIEFLCSPDPESRSKEEGGRRLVRLGQFDYRVVNGAKYTSIRDEESRREQNRINKAMQRAREKVSTAGMNGKQKDAYQKGRKAVSKIGVRAAEIMGRGDQVADAVDDANASTEQNGNIQ